MSSEDEALVCPSCGRRHDVSERFCATCGMPLVHPDLGMTEPVDDARERARKIKPGYTQGPLVKVAGGRNLAEAELIQGMLLEEGIPSVQRRTRGFDVPDFLAAGPRDVLVAEAAYEDARDLLTVVEGERPAAESSEPTSPARLLVYVLIAVAAAFAIVWLLYQVSS